VISTRPNNVPNESGDVVFSAAEMRVLRAVFRGDCSSPRLAEGGDYAYECWNEGMTCEEVDAFLAKLE